jgi:hypothetical protein
VAVERTANLAGAGSLTGRIGAGVSLGGGKSAGSSLLSAIGGEDLPTHTGAFVLESLSSRGWAKTAEETHSPANDPAIQRRMGCLRHPGRAGFAGLGRFSFWCDRRYHRHLPQNSSMKSVTIAFLATVGKSA